MAVDEALLDNAVVNGTATLRFYQWGEPTLSLGYFQPYAERDEHAASRNCAVVRRQSGGGAILHDRELTYSLALPPGHPLVRSTPQLYEAVHQAFIAALMTHSIDGNSPKIRLRGEEPPLGRVEPFLCFERRSAGDVVIETTAFDTEVESTISASESRASWKILGSAQRRHRGAILQHGSLLIERSAAAPELPGLHDLAGCQVRISDFTASVCRRLAASIKVRFVPCQMSEELQSKAADLANHKYGCPSWTKRR